METFLHKSPWVSYMDNFYQDYLILEYPKNIIFTAQILKSFLENAKKIYDKYPYAEKFDISTLDSIDWNKTVISINKYSEFIVAPEPLKQLINLNKRLNFKKAREYLFPSFSFITNYSFVVIFIFLAFFVRLFLRYSPHYYH